MSIITRLASSLGRGDQIPHKELAHELRMTQNKKAIAELIENLLNPNKAIQHDCIAVIEYIGFEDPSVISQYVTEFLHLLSSPDNRMVWGAMIVLSTIALEKADDLFTNLDLIIQTIN